MISRFRRYAREHGLPAALAKAGGEVGRRLYSETEAIVLLKDLDAIKEPRRRNGIEVVELDEGRLAELSELNRRRGRAAVDRRFRDNLARGLRGFVGLRDGVAVGYYWWVEPQRVAAHPDLAWLGDHLRIEPADVYGSDFYVLPEYRAKGTANELLFGIESAIAAAGYERIWGYVESGNRQARWLYSSRGYRPMGELAVRKVLFLPRKTNSNTRLGSHAP